MDWSNYKKVDRNFDLINAIRAMSSVVVFSGFPIETQNMYLRIAAAYPDSNVFACGSRVRGDYVDKDSEAVVHRARKAAGMKPTEQSDFDYVVEPGAKQIHDLPPNCDRCNFDVPNEEKVLICLFTKD